MPVLGLREWFESEILQVRDTFRGWRTTFSTS
jgi:hypothetical protein